MKPYIPEQLGIKVATMGIVECPVQETPLGKGTLQANAQRIKYSVGKLQVFMDYRNVNSFGINNNRVIIFIRNDHQAEDEDQEQQVNIEQVNEIRESLQKNIPHKVNLIGPYKFFLDYSDKQQAKKIYESLVNFSKQYKEQPHTPIEIKNFEMQGKMGNILESMKDDNNFDILNQLDD